MQGLADKDGMGGAGGGYFLQIIKILVHCTFCSGYVPELLEQVYQL